MKTNTYPLIVCIIVLLSSTTFCLDACKHKFTCDATLPNTQCASKAEAAGVISFKLKACAETSNICPLFSIVDPATTADCTAETPLLSYPGGSCNVKTDCVAAATACTSNVCVGIADDAICTSHDQCKIGFACYGTPDKKCKAQVVAGQACTNSFECANNAACTGTPSLCTELFSVADGSTAPADATDLTDAAHKDLNISFCQSGFKDKSGKCQSLTLKAESAGVACTTDESCKYVVKAQTQTKLENFLLLTDAAATDVETTIVGGCDCGYNANGDRYCKEANLRRDGSTVYATYVNEYKTNLTNTKCHTSERFNCKDNKKDPTVYVDRKNNEVNAAYAHRLKNSDGCVVKVLYPFMKKVEVKKCPKVTCETTTTGTCVNAVNKLSENRTVKVNKCATDNTCDYAPASIFSDTNYDAQCIGKPTPVQYTVLPGESCKVNEDCRKIVIKTSGEDFFKCESNLCVGATVNQYCKDNYSCTAGLYCDKTGDTNVCKEQKVATTKCDSTYECKNDLICNKTCVPAYSLEVGTLVTDVDGIFKDTACSTGYKTTDGICATTKYAAKHTQEKGLVKCEFGTKCTYDVTVSKDATVAKRSLELDCECGYNSANQGYCPYSTNDADTAVFFTKTVKLQKENLANKHHTLIRQAGLNDGKHDAACFNYYVNSKFYKAENCIQVVLGLGTCHGLDPEPSPPTPSPSDTSKTSSLFAKISGLVLLFVVMILA